MQYQFLYKVRYLDGIVGESTCAVSWRSWKDPPYHQDWMKKGNHLAHAGSAPAPAAGGAPSAKISGSGAHAPMLPSASAQGTRAQLAKLKKLKLLPKISPFELWATLDLINSQSQPDQPCKLVQLY